MEDYRSQSHYEKRSTEDWWEEGSPIPGLTRDGLVKTIILMVLLALIFEFVDWNHLDAFQAGWWATFRSLL
jgi:hypothetical protein